MAYSAGGYRLPSKPYSRFGYGSQGYMPAIVRGRGALLPSGGNVVIAPPFPLTPAFWAGGGWFDLQAIPGVNGAAIAAPVAPVTGAATTFVPVLAPVIADKAIGGKRGVFFNRTILNYLENDALAAIFNGSNKPWTVVFDFQKYMSATTQVMMGVGATTVGSSRDKIEFSNDINARLFIEEHSIPTGTTDYNTVAVNNYDPVYYVCTWDGTVGKVYENGVLTTITPSAYDTANLIVNRIGWGAAQVGAVGFLGSNGFSRRSGFSPIAATAQQATDIYVNMLGNDSTLPYNDPLTPEFITAGASIMLGSSDIVTFAGYRANLAERIKATGRSWSSVGVSQGLVQNVRTTSNGGQSAAQILTQITNAVTNRTKLVIVDLGNQEINGSQTAPQVLSVIDSTLASIRTVVYAVAPQCQIVVNTILPYADVGFQAVTIAVNAGLPALWDASDAAFSNRSKLIRVDENTAIGGPAYVQANFSAVNDPHPNNQGYNLIWNNALQPAIDYILAQYSPT